ncbi:hypothetical protein IAT40_000422 [Kwoniella sp. CBS 6097]
MGVFATLWKATDKFVDGDVKIVRTFRYKYTIPACHKNIWAPGQHIPKHEKSEEYRKWTHLVEQARRAMEHDDLQAFFYIYCLFAELKKENSSVSTCWGSGADPIQLHCDSGTTKVLKRLCGSDLAAMRRIKRYAWVMEGLVPTGSFKVGAGSGMFTVPLVGAVITFLISFLVYLRTFSDVSAPLWLYGDMLQPLCHSGGVSFAVPVAGGVIASRVSPSRRAARLIKNWLELRVVLANAEEDGSSDTWHCHRLSRVFPELDPSSPHEWRYGSKLRKKIVRSEG